MKPIFCRFGAKTTLRKVIIPMIPDHKVYIEPFIGAGAIYFYKEPSEKEIINDIDTDLMKDYSLIKKSSSNLDKYEKNLNTLEKIKTFYNKKKITNEDKLTHSIIKRCHGFGGKVVVRSNVIYKTRNPFNKLQYIDKYKERMKNTKLYNTDYKNIIKKYDNKHAFFYLDPPYEDSKGLYKEHIINYEELNKILTKLKGKFILSINNSKYMRDLFRNFKQKEVIIKSGGVISNKKGKKYIRKELIIYNF